MGIEPKVPAGGIPGLIAMARIDHGVVTVGVEDQVGDVAEKLLETTRIPGLSDAAGKPAGPVRANAD
jgi:hypothetical protein